LLFVVRDAFDHFFHARSRRLLGGGALAGTVAV